MASGAGGGGEGGEEEEEHVFPDFRESGVFLVCRFFLTHEKVA